MICVGIDIAKGKSTVCFLKPGGEVLKAPYDIEHTAEEVGKLIRDIRSYADVSIPIYEEGTDVKADADSTGFEILLGDTVRRACATVKEQMPDAGGYAVAKVGNQLVLYGKRWWMPV